MRSYPTPSARNSQGFVHHVREGRVKQVGRRLGAMDPIATARYGLMAASQRFEAAATQIAGMGGGSTVDLGEQIVEMVQARQAFSGNLSVIRFAQDMWDSLLKLQSR